MRTMCVVITAVLLSAVLGVGSAESQPVVGDVLGSSQGWTLPYMPTVLPDYDQGEGCWDEPSGRVCGDWAYRPISA